MPEEILASIQQWLFSWAGGAGLVSFAVLAFIFKQWGATWIAGLGKRIIRLLLLLLPLPNAKPKSFAISITNLAGDAENQVKHLIMASLADAKGVEILDVDRKIDCRKSSREDALQCAQAKARRFAVKTGASIAIWGSVIRNGEQTVPRLHLVSAAGNATRVNHYGPYSEDLRLPELFWEDLSHVLTLVVLTEAAAISENVGVYVADRLLPLIERVEAITQSPNNRLLPDSENTSRIRLIVANAKSTYGEQAGDTTRLLEAVTAFRKALTERTRERVPLQWATTQSNLGNALLTIGERENGTTRLDEAVTAFRKALEEYTRERVPLDWAMTQNNLGNALLTIGERENGTTRLDEAVTAFRKALEEFRAAHHEIGTTIVGNNLANVLSLIENRLDEAL